jgi:hypothetical protein
MALIRREGDNYGMKYAFALVMLTLPAMLAAKAVCPSDGAAYDLATGWQASPLFSEQIL